jgi:transposase
MEACAGAHHHHSGKLKTLGHDARLMPEKCVRPHSKGQKNDFREAEAIAEAVQRPTMKFVATMGVDAFVAKTGIVVPEEELPRLRDDFDLPLQSEDDLRTAGQAACRG